MTIFSISPSPTLSLPVRSHLGKMHSVHQARLGEETDWMWYHIGIPTLLIEITSSIKKAVRINLEWTWSVVPTCKGSNPAPVLCPLDPSCTPGWLSCHYEVHMWVMKLICTRSLFTKKKSSMTVKENTCFVFYWYFLKAASYACLVTILSLYSWPGWMVLNDM